MASRRLVAQLAYPSRAVGPRSVTRIDRHSLILVLGLLTLVAFAGVLYLSQASAAAELRYRLADSQAQAQRLWERNFALRQEIADLGRLSAVEERVSRLGMVDAPTSGPYIACTVPQPGVVLNRPAAASGARIDREPAGSLWELLARHLGWVSKPDELAAAKMGRP